METSSEEAMRAAGRERVAAAGREASASMETYILRLKEYENAGWGDIPVALKMAETADALIDLSVESVGGKDVWEPVSVKNE